MAHQTITVLDVFGNEVKTHSPDLTPVCGICEDMERGSTEEKKGPRRAKLITSAEVSSKNYQYGKYSHWAKITIADNDIFKFKNFSAVGAKGLKRNQIYVCAPCYNAYLIAKRYIAQENKAKQEINCLPFE